ncbi:hypothetical protein L9F63_025052 [Diploptera punctata]|uniref:ABC transporter domain-containing protein n=1 Tax=Diploptera punctata TaxID=6984 RepID=A0AAD7ZDB3_DIPPU|nr:hypothetical protein L9F63_025052 [Diploptera punctata]
MAGRKSQKPILRGINGSFRAGRLTAILGPSGAGKSSLLNVLSGFKKNGEFYMLQLLTTKETLRVAADLKLNYKTNKSKKDIMIGEILHLLGLEKTKDTLVKNLSGGEKKRLSIGVELLTNPPVMFFDEPTSGLDSASSLQVISHLKTLAQSGRIVVCTIHQPSSNLFDVFDDLLVLSEGLCLYNGPISEMKLVFENAGFHCPKYYNRADFAIEVACHERGDNIESLIAKYNTSQNKDEEMRPSDEEAVNEESIMLQVPNLDTDESSSESKKSYSRYPVPLWFQIHVLIKRSIWCSSRDIFMMYIRIITHIIIGLTIGAVCYNIGNEASKTASNAACLFYIALCLFTIGPFVTVLVYPMEASVFLQEHQNNWYSLKAYFFSKIIADIPFQILCPSLLLGGAYTLSGQPYDLDRILKSWVLCILMTVCGQTLGLLLGAIFDVQLGLFMTVALNIPMSLFSGFFMRLDDIPDYLKWLTYVSYFRHAFQAEMVNLYGGNREKLNCSEDFCYFQSPQKVLKDFGLSESTYEINLGAILLWLLGSLITFYLVLKWRIYKSR